jgi:hypothetical protein
MMKTRNRDRHVRHSSYRKLLHLAADFIDSLRHEADFAGAMNADRRAFRQDLLQAIRAQLRLRRGRRSDPRLDHACELLKQGESVATVLRSQIPNFDSLDPYTRYLAERGLRQAAARRKKWEKQSKRRKIRSTNSLALNSYRRLFRVCAAFTETLRREPEFAEAIKADLRGFRTALLQALRAQLRLRRGRRSDPRLDRACELLKQGASLQEVLRSQIPEFEKLDTYTQYLAAKGLRQAAARRGKASKGPENARCNAGTRNVPTESLHKMSSQIRLLDSTPPRPLCS